MLVRLYSAEPGDWGDETLQLTQHAIPLLETEQAHDELATAWRLVGFVHGVAGRYGQVGAAVSKSMTHARLAGDERLVGRSGMALATSALLGPTPVLEAIAQCERIINDGLADRQVEAIITCIIARLRAMNGEFEPAWRLVRRGRAVLRDLGQGVTAASTGFDLAQVAWLAGDWANAEAEVRADYEFLAAAGETYYLPTLATLLARLLREQGRDDEALLLTEAAERSAGADDFDAQAFWRSTRAPIVARSGDLVHAERLAREAIDYSMRTEIPSLQADALAELAAVLHIAGQAAPARSSIEAAIELSRRKGDIASGARALRWAQLHLDG
jgi:ATP/maltotriose-dependent transcriptional regulator MalT